MQHQLITVSYLVCQGDVSLDTLENQHLVVVLHLWHNHILLYLIKYNLIQNLLAIETNLVYISTRCDIDSDEA